jgi:hypothetical protein
VELNEIINPKKTLQRREAAQEVELPASAPPSAGAKFGKAWTPQEKADQAKALAKKLRERG